MKENPNVGSPFFWPFLSDRIPRRGKWSMFIFLIQVFSDEGARDSAVGIAIRYGLNGQGIESRWGRDFPHPFRPSLEPTQSPVQWVPGLSRM